MSRLSQMERERAAQVLIDRHGEAGRHLLAKKAPLMSNAASAKNDENNGIFNQSPLPDASARTVREAMVQPPFAVRVLNNLTFGATEKSIASFNALGTTDLTRLTAFVDQQLNPSGIGDGTVNTILNDVNNNFVTLSLTLQELWQTYKIDAPRPSDSLRPAQESQLAALVRAVYSNRQVFEMAVSFWHDHFNVFYAEPTANAVFSHYTRAVIRPNALGNFRTMLEAVTKSTSMMYYLDNYSSTVSGPNENFSRELLELHTLGADYYLGNANPLEVPDDNEDPNYPAGYVDTDVYATADALTGWTIKNGRSPFQTENDGTFVYRSQWHNDHPKIVLGMFLPAAQAAMKDGRDILDRLASHPKTARHICTKLIRRFVSDTPPQALVDSAAQIFRANWQNPDQIKITLRHIMLSQALQDSWGNKIRRLFEVMVAALRTGGSTWAPRFASATAKTVLLRVSEAGHGVFEWPAPNGYADIASPWLATNSMVATWRFLQWLPDALEDGTGSTNILPILTISRDKLNGTTATTTWTAQNLVNYWCKRLLGYLPAETHRQVLIAFLAQNGDPATDIIPDTNVSSRSDLKNHFCQQRIRSMVSLILMSPEFTSR